jgi:hypothetical protein
MTMSLVAVALLAAWMVLLPTHLRPWNLSAIGALGLFAAARLGFWPAVGFTALALGIKDLAIYLQYSWGKPAPLTWLCFAGYVTLGWAFLRRTESPCKIAAATLVASLLFFLVSNFGSWLGQALPYGYSISGLIDCYTAAIPFYRGTLAGDLLFSGGLFAAHAVLSRAFFPAERVELVPVTDRMESEW